MATAAQQQAAKAQASAKAAASAAKAQAAKAAAAKAQAAPKAPSGQNISAAHPTWYTGPAKPINDPGTWKPAPAASTTPAPAAPTPPASAPVSPFLTPQQTLDQINFDSGIDSQIQALNDTLRTSTIDTNQALADAQRGHDINTESENESAAARGLFQSSIRASDLNDIDATLATRQNTLNTALQSLTTSTGTNVTRLNTQRGGGDTAFLGMAVQNAQQQTPVLPPASSSTHTTPNPSATPAINDPGTWKPTTGPGAIAQVEAQPSGQNISAAHPNWYGQVKPPSAQATGPTSSAPKRASQGSFSSTVKPPKGMSA